MIGNPYLTELKSVTWKKEFLEKAVKIYFVLEVFITGFSHSVKKETFDIK